MIRRTTLAISLELCSDTIFGSGFSIPGGEDIAVCQDKDGYPYLKGSTFKGLFRESLENWLVWTGENEETAEELCGAADWSGTAEERRIHWTELRLAQLPSSSEDCYSTRTFTAVENGTAKDNTLRMASCINRGLRFAGEMECEKDDVELIGNVLQCMKWAGTMRNRGFGRIKVTWKEVSASDSKQDILTAAEDSNFMSVGGIGASKWIRYRITSNSPLIITDLTRSHDNSYETRDFIPGTAVRGLVIGRLAQTCPEWFEAHRRELLSDDVCFLDAVPARDFKAPLPSIMGFYEDKKEEHLETVVKDGNFTPGLKRAKLKRFCAIEGEELCCWSAETDSAIRIQIQAGEGKTEGKPFQTRHLSEGQIFEGYIYLNRHLDFAENIVKVLPGTAWLGADRYEGFGRCTIDGCKAVNAPSWQEKYGFSRQEELTDTFYMLAVSPFTMIDAGGNPCGIQWKQLSEKLGVESAEQQECSTSVAEFSEYNRTWKCRSAAASMYERGSIFKIHCNTVPSIEKLQAVEREGLGIRLAEGFGRVLFLNCSIIDGIQRKKILKPDASNRIRTAAAIRRAKYRWIMDQRRDFQGTLSASQVGTLQALCEKASTSNDSSMITEYLRYNQEERGARHADRYTKICELMKNVLEKPMCELIEIPCEDSLQERLKLLCMLFDYSRKEA